MKAFLDLLRPFTLLPPLFGIVSGSIAAIGSRAAAEGERAADLLARCWLPILLGGAAAAVLNGASNVFNQITERELDRRNKPTRVLPSGRMSPATARGYCALLYAAALGMAWWIQPAPGVRDTFWCVLVAAGATMLYSARPCYLKTRGWWANVAIAVPRGMLLKVAGWGCVAAALSDPEPWFIGAVFMLFLIGAASTKDFSDAAGDREAGCRTLVVRYGPQRVVRWISPFFVLPWLLLAAGVFLPRPGDDGPLLSAAPVPTCCVAGALVCYGAYVVRLMRRDPNAIAAEANHPSWAHMYGMMMAAQVGLAAMYLL